jgi:antitoxin component YwqK of YwqJK toxin-antitoxin module
METIINLDATHKYYLALLGYVLFQKASFQELISENILLERYNKIKTRFISLSFPDFKETIIKVQSNTEIQKINQTSFRIQTASSESLLALDILSEISSIPDDVLQHTLLDYIDLDKVKTYHSNGTIFEDYTLAFGKNHGLYKLYNQNIRDSESTYIHGKLIKTLEYNPNCTIKTLLSITNYYDDISITKRFYCTGAIFCLEHYKDSKLHGALIRYFQSGKINEIQHYKNGKLNGEWIIYYKNGNIKYSENYINGHRNGDCFTYTENGELIKKETYTKGICNIQTIYKHLTYDENKKMIGKETFIDSIRQGQTITYNKQGNIIKKEYFPY